MNVFRLVLRKDLLRKLRTPMAAIAMLLFPIVFSFLIGLAFGGSGDKMAPIRMVLVDEDGGTLSKLLRSSFTQDRAPEQFEITEADLPAAMKLVEEDKVSAVLRVPAGFTDSVLAQKPSTLELTKNPAQSIYPGIAEQYVKVLAQVGGSAVRILGPPLREIREESRDDRTSPPDGRWTPDAFVSRVSVDISNRIRAVSRYALPPAIRLVEVTPGAAKDTTSDATTDTKSGAKTDTKSDAQKAQKDDSGPSSFRVALFVLPGMAVYALLMLALVGMQDFQREGARGTLARQFVAPVRFGLVVAGKMGATWIVSLISIALLSAVAVFWVGKGVSLVGFLALSVVFAFAATGFAAFIQSLSYNERSGSIIGSILVMIMSMLGGSFVPLNALPGFVQRIAPFTLNYWGVEGYQKLLFADAGVVDLGRNLLVLTVLGLIFSIVASARFTRRYGTGG